LKLFSLDTESRTETSACLMLVLSDGLLSYFNFPKITLVDDLTAERYIIDFDIYNINRRTFIALLQKSPKAIKIYRIHQKNRECEYVT